MTVSLSLMRLVTSYDHSTCIDASRLPISCWASNSQFAHFHSASCLNTGRGQVSCNEQYRDRARELGAGLRGPTCGPDAAARVILAASGDDS